MGPGDVHREGHLTGTDAVQVAYPLQWGPVMFTGKDSTSGAGGRFTPSGFNGAR